MRIARLDAYPALPAALGAVSGVLAVDYPWFWLAAVAIFILMIFVRVRLVPALLFIVMASATALTAWRMELRTVDASVFDGRERLWAGTVERVRPSDRSQRCVVAFDSPVPLRCRMTLADLTPGLREGDIIEVEGVAESTRKYASAPRLSFAADRSERTDADMLVMHHSCRITGHSASLWYRLQDFRHELAQYVYDSPLSASTSRLLAASVFGGGDVGDDRKEAFRASGLSHLLCVSGFHVAVFALVIAFLLFPMKIGERFGRSRYLFVVLAVWVYAAATGLQPSVFRAAIMLTVYNLARFFQRNSPPMNSLCLSVAIILAVNPLWLFSIGFQLSVAAVAGLLVLSEKLNPVRRRHKLFGLFALFAVPLAATIATAPVLLWHFHSLPLLTVPANALTSLIFPMFMVLGSLVVFLAAIGLPAGFAAKAVDRLADVIDRICSVSVDMQWANPTGIRLCAYSMTALCLCIVLLAVVLYIRSLKPRLIFTSMALLLLASAFFIPESASARDIVVHGNAYSSEIRVRCGECGYIVPLSSRRRPIGNPDNYFLDGGISVDMTSIAPDSIEHGSLRLHNGMLRFGDRIMLIAATDTCGTAERADILLLKARYRGCIDSLLARNRPSTVILASDMDPDRREAYAAAALNAGLTVCDLTREVFRQPF